MKFNITFIKEALDDVYDIYQYISNYETTDYADRLLSELEKACLSLDIFPERGHLTPEAEKFGEYDFREIHHKHYRIIYQVVEKTVFIYGVFDSKRNISEFFVNRISGLSIQ